MTRAYHFGGFRLDLVRRQVVASDGTDLPIPARAYDLLLHLILHRQEVLSKDDLMAAVWPGMVVEENTISQAVSSVRRALADSRAAPRFIATVPGRGYRFVAEVTEESPVSAPDASASSGPEGKGWRVSRRFVLAGATTSLAVATGWLAWTSRPAPSGDGTRSIAVLPFQPLVGSVDDSAFRFGMTDALINRLSGIQGLVVAPFSSVRAYGELGEDPLAAGRALRVSAVLESNVQLKPDRIRLSARLLDVRSGAALWSDRFDEDVGDVFAIQDVLAQRVVDALELEISPSSRQRLSEHPTDDFAAWQLYLKGRFHWNTRTREGFDQAITHYEAALAADPEFALAASGLADAWAVKAVFNMVPPAPAFVRARRAAERAVALDAHLAEAHASLGHVLVQGDRDWKGGEAQYRLALSLHPTYAQAAFWMANNACFQGRHAEALSLAVRAQSMEPASVVFAANVGMIQYYARDFAGARKTLSDLVATVPEYPLARRFLVRVLLAQGEVTEAMGTLRGHEQEFAPGSLSDAGRVLAQDGQRGAAHREIARLEKLGARGFGVGYDIALTFAALGERDRAMVALQGSVADGSQMVGFILSDPGLDPIRDDVRFHAVVESLSLG